MNKLLVLVLIVFLNACSHQETRKTVTISTTTKGIVKNSNLESPLYLTTNLNDNDVPKNAIRIHQGHFLSLKFTKEANLKTLKELEEKFSLINLTLEDIAIAEKQEINFEDFPKLIFLNSTVSDLSRDDLFGRKNVVPYYEMSDVVFIGLSDTYLEKTLNTNRYLINDYVFSVLKIKKLNRDKNIKSYILIHNLGSDINDIMGRLPPTFINSLAD